jgi:hypothetical protein
MKEIVFTQQEIWDASKHSIQKSKKQYSRKEKHKDNRNEDNG